jgi:hypothetical protein
MTGMTTQHFCAGTACQSVQHKQLLLTAALLGCPSYDAVRTKCTTFSTPSLSRYMYMGGHSPSEPATVHNNKP